MADSDEEYDRRKGRDKFRRERNDYERRDDRRRDSSWDHDRRGSGGRSRDMWSNRGNRDNRRESYGRDYDSRRRDRFSPGRHDISPPHKRMRRDWDDGGGGGGGYGGHYGMGFGGPMHGPPHPGMWVAPEMGPPQQQAPFPTPPVPEVDYPTQPPVLTFKQFLSQQDDNINDQDAIKKYNEYKKDFRRQQISEFFLAHKEEEWFKFKYHPEECDRKQEVSKKRLNNRLNAFVDLMDKGRFEPVTLDVDNSEEIVKLLDAAVIKMEGGTDFDLTILDAETEEKEECSRSRNNSESIPIIATFEKSSPEEKRRKRTERKESKEDPKLTDPDKPLKMNVTREQRELVKKAKEFIKQKTEKEETEPKEDDDDDDKEKNASRKHESYNYDSESESESGTYSDSEPMPPGVEDAEPGPPGIDNSDESRKRELTETKAVKKEDLEDGEEKDDDTKEKNGEILDNKPRCLHKTSSIFLRNLAPTITKQEVESVCKRYQGFIRVALQDPQPERRFFRRGWVTFEKSVNIKEICWNLNNIRLRECDLGATLNRELKQRVRPIDGIAGHKLVVRQDILSAAKIIQNLDNKWHLWEDEEHEKGDHEKGQISCNLVSKNPVLKNITDYLVEEGNYEEEELLGQSVEDKKDGSSEEIPMDRDENILKALDRMVLYLRIVHSVDYYSCNDYPNEDEMPHRCGIMHSRGSAPSKITQTSVNEWMKSFDNKIKQYTDPQEKIDKDEAVQLGKKDPEAEVEKFIQSNTQELAKDKWLCPISGKKFKGPEFVRKHILNKHSEKIEEVKKEVEYFNNYLLDPKRPNLPEHPASKQQDSKGQFQSFQGPPQQMMPMPPMMYRGNGPPQFAPGFRDGGFRGDGFRRPYRNRRSDTRAVIDYRDLDAPEDFDF